MKRKCGVQGCERQAVTTHETKVEGSGEEVKINLCSQHASSKGSLRLKSDDSYYPDSRRYIHRAEN